MNVENLIDDMDEGEKSSRSELSGQKWKLEGEKSSRSEISGQKRKRGKWA